MSKDEEYREGRKRLARLLPLARARARKEMAAMRAEPGTDLGSAMTSHIREDKIDAVMVYATTLGGWHCDVLFSGMPPGFPNSMGTPVGLPLSSREEAEAHAEDLLTSILIICRKAKEQKEEKEPVFLLFGASFTLRREVYDALLARYPEAGSGYGSKEDAISRIEAIFDELLPGADDDTFKGRWEALPEDGKLRIFTVLHIAALTGLYAYPPRLDAAPDPEKRREVMEEMAKKGSRGRA